MFERPIGLTFMYFQFDSVFRNQQFYRYDFILLRIFTTFGIPHVNRLPSGMKFATLVCNCSSVNSVRVKNHNTCQESMSGTLQTTDAMQPKRLILLVHRMKEPGVNHLHGPNGNPPPPTQRRLMSHNQKRRGDYFNVCQLWLPERRSGLDSRVKEGANPAVFNLFQRGLHPV